MKFAVLLGMLALAGASAAFALSTTPTTGTVTAIVPPQTITIPGQTTVVTYTIPTVTQTVTTGTAPPPAPIFSSAFDTPGSGFVPPWYGTFAAGSWSLNDVASDGPVLPRKGAGMLRVELRSGDDPISTGGNIAQVYGAQGITNGTEHLGDNRFYGFSVYLPCAMPLVPGTTWNQFFEIHTMSSTAQAPIHVGVNTIPSPSQLFIDLHSGTAGGINASGHQWTVWNIGAFSSHCGSWQDVVFHVNWSQDPSVGYIEVWLNGSVVVPQTFKETVYNDGISADTNMKLQAGLYTQAFSQTRVIYLDEIKTGDTYATVAPG